MSEGTTIELEHAIGFSCMPAGLHYHPTTSEFVYAAGGTIVVCDSKDPHNQVFLRGHDANISCLTMSKSGRYLASGQYGENADVLVWDFHSKKLLYRFAEHDFGIQCLAFSDDEMLLSTVGDGMEDKRMFIWDLRTGNIVTSTFASPSKTTCVTWGRFVKDIKRRETSIYQLATAGEKGVVLWSLDPYSGECEQSKVQQQQTRDFTCLRFSADCNTLFGGTTSGDFVVMNVRNKNSEGSVAASNTGVHSLEYFDDEDGAHVIAGGGTGPLVSSCGRRRSGWRRTEPSCRGVWRHSHSRRIGWKSLRGRCRASSTVCGQVHYRRYWCARITSLGW